MSALCSTSSVAGLPIRAASQEHRRPLRHHGHTSSSTPSSGNSWWAPLFGWSSDADYLLPSASPPADKLLGLKLEEEQRQQQQQPGNAGRRTGRANNHYAVLTEEKAKQLRIRRMETETFHDAMYHSAIASRLASDLPSSSRTCAASAVADDDDLP